MGGWRENTPLFVKPIFPDFLGYFLGKVKKREKERRREKPLWFPLVIVLELHESKVYL